MGEVIGVSEVQDCLGVLEGTHGVEVLAVFNLSQIRKRMGHGH